MTYIYSNMPAIKCPKGLKQKCTCVKKKKPKPAGRPGTKKPAPKRRAPAKAPAAPAAPAPPAAPARVPLRQRVSPPKMSEAMRNRTITKLSRQLSEALRKGNMTEYSRLERLLRNLRKGF